MLDYAPPDLAAEMVPLVLRGDETWCQGFSEPGSGSNLASLACRATRTAGGWEVTGQKVWTSLAQFAQRCVLLTRTGSPESAHRGITAFFVDMDSPGITVRPIETMHGVEEFCEVFFDGVVVPADRLLGEVDGGWSVAMDLLPYERSTALWQRAAYLQRRLQQLVHRAPPGSLDPADLGAATELLWAFRARSRTTQYRLDAGEHLGAETSVDKVLVAAAEQAVFELAGDALGTEIALGDDPANGSVARRVPVRARRQHLRRQRRDPAQHHRPTPPRARGRPVMERAELALFTRGIRDATESASGAALDGALTELGWLDAIDTDPQAAVSVLFECQGASNATSSALDRVLTRGLGLTDEPAQGVVLPALRTAQPPGSRHGARYAVGGVALGALGSRDTALVVMTVDEQPHGVLSVPVHALGLRQVAGLDPALGLVEVTGDLDSAENVVCGPVPWTMAVALGQLALGHELVGTARTMLELARQHTLERVQFGRTIGSFQAVRHRLADSLVAIEAAAALLDAAWQDPTVYGAMAKSFAGRQARLVSRHCQQVLAGIGFTAEHPFHHFVRRTIVLDQLLGAGTVLTRGFGAEVLASGELPPAFPL